MVRLSERTVFSFLICAFSVVLLSQTLEMRADAALVPRVIGVPLFILSGFQFLCDLFPAVANRFSFAGVDKAGMDNSKSEEEFGLKGNYLFIACCLSCLCISWVLSPASLSRFSSISDFSSSKAGRYPYFTRYFLRSACI